VDDLRQIATALTGLAMTWGNSAIPKLRLRLPPVACRGTTGAKHASACRRRLNGVQTGLVWVKVLGEDLALDGG
jgi:hypothetical protein